VTAETKVILGISATVVHDIVTQDGQVIEDTFDWYAPQFKWRHTYGEVTAWFREAGLEEIRCLPVPVAVRGKRPEAPPRTPAEPARSAARA